MAAARRYGLPTRWGSYAMVIGPRKSASGHAVLVGGPQMGFMTPQIAHEVHLVAPGLNVIGMGFAGIPGVLIGFNEHLAWTTTSGESDAADVFVETTNPDDPHQYRHGGRWLTMERRTETIAVRGGEPVTMEIFRTVHGPVIQEDTAHHLAYSQATTYWDHEGEALEGLFRFNRAADVREFGAAVERIPTMHNWLCATQGGDIGYWFGGWYPVRAAGIDTRFPTPGTGEYDWRGTRPVRDNPHVVNPRQGWLANWNNKPAPGWDHGDTPIWGEIQHVNRMMQQLAAKPLLSVDDVKEILVDIGLNDARAAALKPILLDAARRHAGTLSPRAREAVRYLTAWDDHATDGSVAKTLFDAWVDQARLELFEDDFGPAPDPALMRQALSPSLILHAFQGKRASVRLSRDYRNGKDADTIALAALEKALAQLEAKNGPQMSTWRYRQSTIRLAPLPDIPRTDRGTFIQVVELSRPRIVGESILPPGQSEDPASPHFSDQRELASWWMFKPMFMREDEIGG